MDDRNSNAGESTTGAPAAPVAPPYEFSDTENNTVGRTAKWAKALALMFFFQVFLQLMNLNILGIVLDLAIGISFWKGADLLQKVVDTKDDDVPHMLGALDQLRNAFTIRIVVTGIAAALGVIVSVGFFVQYEYLYDPADLDDPAAATVEADEEADEDEPEAGGVPAERSAGGEAVAAPADGEAPAEGAAPDEGEAAAPAEAPAAGTPPA